MQYQKTHHFFSNQVQIAAFWVPKISCLSRHVPNFVTSLQAATQSSVPTLLGSTSLMKFRGSVSPGPPGENIWQNPPLSNVLYPHCSKSFLHFFLKFENHHLHLQQSWFRNPKGTLSLLGGNQLDQLQHSGAEPKKNSVDFGPAKSRDGIGELLCTRRGDHFAYPRSCIHDLRRGRSWMRSWPVVAKLTTARRINFR